MKHNHDEERLRAMLREDVGGDDYLDVVARLRQWRAPRPEREAELLQTLAAELPAPASVSWRRRLADWRPLLLLRAQARIVQGEIWVVSALMMLLGTLVTLALQTSQALPLALLAPVVAAFGVCVVYGPLSDPALEMERAAPTPARVILLARLILIFGFDLALALAGSAALAVFSADVGLWPIVSAWFAPMAFLSALAFLLSVLLVEATLAMALSLGLWIVQVLRHTVPDLTALHPIPNLLALDMQPLLLLLAWLLAGAALWLVEHDERWLQHV